MAIQSFTEYINRTDESAIRQINDHTNILVKYTDWTCSKIDWNKYQYYQNLPK